MLPGTEKSLYGINEVNRLHSVWIGIMGNALVKELIC